MNVFAIFETHVRDAVAAIASRGLLASSPDLARIVVEPPRDPTHGDVATNAAMVLPKDAGMKPRDLAELIATELRAVPDITRVEVAGPGFINISVATSVWGRCLAAILREGAAYGRSVIGAGERVNVEFVSANPTGPMHVGHCRGAVVGDALANLLTKAGWAVIKEYYVNDAGAQVQALAYAAYWRYLQALGSTMTEEEYAASVPGGLQYGGDYLVAVGDHLRGMWGDKLAGPDKRPADPELWLGTIRDHTVAYMMERIRDDLAALGVRHDVFV